MNKVEYLREELLKNGYKLTTQRRVIFEILLEQEDQHLSPEEIFDIVKNKYPEIGLATIYRTLQLFEQIGIVYKMNFNDGCYRYEITINESSDQHRHHHLICKECGKIIGVKEDLLNSLEEIVEKQYKFQIIDHSLKFIGICADCRKIKEKQ